MRMDQRKLFIQINAIDSFLLNQMGIRLDYPAERQRHFIQFMRWMLIKGSAVVYGVLSRPPQQEGLLFSTIFISYHFVVFIITLSMYQFVTLVDIVGSRYRAINDHIDNVVLNDPRRKTENEYFLTDVLTSATEERHSEDDEDEQLQEKFHFLQQLREVSHSLDGVTQEINRIFGASLAAFTFKSAMNLIILAYFSFEVAVSHDSVYMFLGACVHTFVRIYDIRKISNVCEYTTEQVSSLEFIMIMVIYFYLMVFFIKRGIFFTLVIYFHVFQSRKFIHCVQKLSFESPDNIFGRLVRLFIIRDSMPPSLFISDHEQITCRLLSLGHLNILPFLLLFRPFSFFLALSPPS